MKVKVNTNRQVFKGSLSVGISNENNYEVLEFTFPAELDNYIKYIEIQAENEEGKLEYVDRIQDNKFTLTNRLTKYRELNMEVSCRDLNRTVFKSEIFTVTTGEALNILEDLVEQQEDLFERVERELQEVYQGMEEFKTEIVEDANSRFNTNVREKTQGFDTNAETKTTDFNNNYDTKLNSFNSNYDEKLGTFNTNATSKLEEYNNNDTTKTEAYNTNATEKLSTYNQNATSKVAEYNSNAESKLEAYNTNATQKLAEYDSRVAELHEDLDETQAKVEQYNTNIDTKYTQYNTNAEQKLNAYNQNATTKTSEYNTNAQTKLEAYNTNATAKMTAYNENAEEKLQEYNENASSLMQSVETLEQKHNTEVAELQAEITDLQTDLNMATDLIPTAPATGSDITVNDSARYYFKKFEIEGKSEQETFTGKNKFDISTITENKYLSAQDGNIGNSDVSNVSDYTKINSESTYTLSFDYVTLMNSAARNIAFYDEDKTFISAQSYILSTKLVTFITPENAEYLRFSYDKNCYDIQLEEGSTATDYEPYTGGQPAPRPDYECPIQNIGDNVNLFDYEYFYNNYVEKSKSNAARLLLTLKPNTKYTVSSNIPYGGDSSYSARLFAVTGNDTQFTPSSTNDGIFPDRPRTITSDNNGNIVIALYTKGNYAITKADFDNGTFYIKLEEGTKATPYSPYNCGNVNVKVKNINVFEVGNSTQDYFKSSGVTPNLTVSNNQLAFVIEAGGATYGYKRQNLKGNKQYTFKAIYSISNGRFFIRIRSLDNTRWLTNNDFNLTGFTYNSYYGGWYVEFTGTTGIKAFSIPNCYYWQIGFGFDSSRTGTTQTISNIQLLEGTYTSETMPDYEVHEEQTVTFPLSEGQVLHETDTIEDKIVQRRKTRVFDGNENWQQYGDNVTLANWDNKETPQHYTPQGYLCNIATEGKESQTENNNKFATYNWQNVDWIVFNINTTVADWKAYLAQQYANGTPITLEYELETPIETEFTEAQKTAKKEIDKLYSYKGTTHITSEANLNVIYRKDLETMIDNLSNAIVAQGGV